MNFGGHGARLLIAAFVFGMSAAQVAAQDQVVMLNGDPHVCGGGVSAPDAGFDEAHAATLIQDIFPNVDPAKYYLIHVVHYVDHRFVVSTQEWYVYHQDWVTNRGLWGTLNDPRVRSHFKETRVFGSANLAMAYLHVNVDAVAVDAAKQKQPDEAGRKLIDAVAKNDSQAIGNQRLVDKNSQTDIVRLSDTLLVGGPFGPLQGLTYRVDITKKVPAPVQNLQGLLRVIGQGASVKKTEIDTAQVSLCGGGTFTVKPIPSDMQVTVLVGAGDKAQTLGKQTYDNENKYWYDFSFALPVKSYSQLTLSDNGQVVAQKVNKADLFAVVNLSLPFDTKHAQAQIIPVFLYGMPINSNPIQHHLIAAAFGLNRVQAFVGVRFDRNTAASVTGSSGVATAVLEPTPTPNRWSHTLTFGINLPVTTVTAALGGKDKAGK